MGFWDKLFGNKSKDKDELFTPKSTEQSANTHLNSHDVVEAMLTTAQVAMDKGDYTVAVETYKDILKLESISTAQYNLGSLYSQGKGVAQDFMEGAYYFHQAELTGDEQAGKLCLKCSMDFIHANFAAKSPEQIYSDMVGFVKRVYPDVGDVNLKVCRSLYAMAGNHFNKEEFAEAFKLFRSAAEFGQDGYSQNYLAVLYNAGKGCEQNDIAALYWFDKAVDHGAADVALADRNGLLAHYKKNFPADVFSATMNKLADWCKNGGNDVPKDEAKAAYWREIATSHGDTILNRAVYIISGDSVVKNNPDTVFEWPNIDGKNIKLKFQSAYEVTYRHIGDDIGDTVFQINGQNFTYRDSMKGESVQKFPVKKNFGDERTYSICKLKSGIQALRHYHEVPTFDSGDREWDGSYNISLYRDKEGINLIQGRSGYRLGRVYIYVGLTEWDESFDEWLKYL